MTAILECITRLPTFSDRETTIDPCRVLASCRAGAARQIALARQKDADIDDAPCGVDELGEERPRRKEVRVFDPDAALRAADRHPTSFENATCAVSEMRRERLALEPLMQAVTHASTYRRARPFEPARRSTTTRGAERNPRRTA